MLLLNHRCNFHLFLAINTLCLFLFLLFSFSLSFIMLFTLLSLFLFLTSHGRENVCDENLLVVALFLVFIPSSLTTSFLSQCFPLPLYFLFPITLKRFIPEQIFVMKTYLLLPSSLFSFFLSSPTSSFLSHYLLIYFHVPL